MKQWNTTNDTGE